MVILLKAEKTSLFSSLYLITMLITFYRSFLVVVMIGFLRIWRIYD